MFTEAVAVHEIILKDGVVVTANHRGDGHQGGVDEDGRQEKDPSQVTVEPGVQWFGGAMGLGEQCFLVVYQAGEREEWLEDVHFDENLAEIW